MNNSTKQAAERLLNLALQHVASTSIRGWVRGSVNWTFWLEEAAEAVAVGASPKQFAAHIVWSATESA